MDRPNKEIHFLYMYPNVNWYKAITAMQQVINTVAGVVVKWQLFENMKQ